MPKKPAKVVRRYALSVAIDGVTYRGERDVIGSRRFDQVIHFEGLSDTDYRGYSQKEWRVMEDHARRILLGLVQQVAKRHRAAR